MTVKNNIEILKQVVKIGNNTSTLVLEKVKSTKSVEETISQLKKEGVQYFELVDSKKKTKTVYSKLLSGNNYEEKTVKM